MSSAWITLEDVTYKLPNGELLLHGLSERFDAQRTGLVGRNGVGKTVLARLMCGELAASSGRIQRSTRGHLVYIPQLIDPARYETVADVARVRHVLDAMQRITNGSNLLADFETVEGLWDLPERLTALFDEHGLSHLQALTPAAQLSGGECTRVAMLGAQLLGPAILLLDEPSNHLDREGRAKLVQQLNSWPSGLLVISHDRGLLEHMERIVELTPNGLKSYGGNYEFFVAAKVAASAAAQQRLSSAVAAQERVGRQMRERAEQRRTRQARLNHTAKDLNLPKLALGTRKAASEGTAGRLQRQHERRALELAGTVEAASQCVEETAEVAFPIESCELPTGKSVLEMRDAELPHGPERTRQVNLVLVGPQRIAVVGPNGCGKSTLLRLLAGHLEPRAGECVVKVPRAYLDQHTAMLRHELSILQQLEQLCPTTSHAAVRTKLALASLGEDRIRVPSGALSGGERLKAALCVLLAAEPVPQLLLLDEPSNHLDLQSIAELEAMLLQYDGALLIVTHDTHLMRNLQLTQRLSWSPEGWQLLHGIED